MSRLTCLGYALLAGCPVGSTLADSGADSGAESGADTADNTPDDTGNSGEYNAGSGPYRVTASTVTWGGESVDLYTPTVDGPRPGVIWSHGFARGPQFHVAAAERAASWGFLVAAVSLPSFSDHAANGSFIADSALPEVDAGAGAFVVGHSAGGLASLVAAAAHPVDAYVGLDPVDADELGLATAPAVNAPALVLHGLASSCNADANSWDWALPNAWQVGVTDASHCDFESNTEGGCETFCGSADATRQELIQAYAVAWLMHHSGQGADDWIEGGAQAIADTTAGRIE